MTLCSVLSRSLSSISVAGTSSLRAKPTYHEMDCIGTLTSLRGVKKPLNPILGETFYGYWDYSDGTRGYYIAEQTSHHPPKSSYFFMTPEHHIRIDGTLKPRSKFLGNSAASLSEGLAVMRFLNRGER